MEMTAIQSFRNDLQRNSTAIQPLMKEETEKFIQIAGNFVEQNPKLLGQNINRASLFSAIIKAAQFRLFIDGQEASLVPFKENVQMMTGYKGILKMVRNSGELSSINAGVVYEKDIFEYFVDEKGEHIMHKPSFVKDRGDPVQTYCIARTKGNAEPYIEVMQEEEIEACKKSSAAVKFGGDTPWKGPFVDEMRKKTVIRRISKRLPMSTDLNTAIHSDDALFNAPSEEDQPKPEPKTQSSRLENAVAPQKTENSHQATEPTPEEEKKKIDAAQETFSQKIQGVIEKVNVRDNPKAKDPAKSRRFTCTIKGQFYGTFYVELYKKIEDLFNKKVEVELKFIKKMNTQEPPQPYNEILDISEIVTEEEVPI